MPIYTRRPVPIEAVQFYPPATVLLGDTFVAWDFTHIIHKDEKGYYISVSYCGVEKRVNPGDYLVQEILDSGTHAAKVTTPFLHPYTEAEFTELFEPITP